MKLKKSLSLLGLCARSRNLVSGEQSVEKAVRSGTAYLVAVAGDASENTKKNFRDMCAYYEVPYLELGEKTSLGKAIGKEFRASLAVCDRGFAEAILKLWESPE